jgi:endonuclease YncB( thermonuclease family)
MSLVARLIVAAGLIISSINGTLAAEMVVRSGDTLQLGRTVYRLASIDAPAFDQVCLNEYADPWACGVEARDQLIALIGKRAVRCQDLGPDKTYGKWRSAICSVEGEPSSLNRSMVRKGFALNVEPTGPGRFAQDEVDARTGRDGLWKGCFVAPHDFQRWDEQARLRGAAGRSDKDREIRDVVFPARSAAPPGCAIKGKFALRAHVTGNVGVYQLQGCRAYPTTTKPDRWFCTEEDAQAAGFRRAYNCRAPRSK